MKRIFISLAFIPVVLQQGTHFICRNEYGSTKSELKQEKCLAVMIYGEARGEPVKGQVAVAYTAVNRAVNKTVCKVVLAPKQYSIFNDNPYLQEVARSKTLEPVQKNITDSRSWKQAVKIAKSVLKREVRDPTKGATHYLAYKSLNHIPRWSREFTKTAEIENHTFFKARG